MKKRVEDLAVFGGPALFSSVKPIGQLDLPDEDTFFAYAREVFSVRRMTNNGPMAQRLEARLAAFHDTEHCIAFASASLAILLLLEILAQGRSGEVIMPAFTYAGLPHLAQWAGQNPRFCDIDPSTHTLAPQAVIEAVSSDTTAILAVHQVNSPCLIDELQEIADAENVPLCFDSVHGLYCTYKGHPIGGFGEAEVFSLHATKLINGFEGGYITTNNDELADSLRRKRNFGFDSNAEIVTLGMNAKLNEIHAALALASLDNLETVVARNKERLDAYVDSFKDIPGLRFVPYQDAENQMNYEFALLEVDFSWPLTRNEIVSLLRKENALARAYYSPPLHLSGHCPDHIDPPHLPVTEALHPLIIQMPVGELISTENIRDLSTFMEFLYENGQVIADSLPQMD
jgi:dTDP-4-amino-4,6-dideoxygalactose transaminase